MREKSEEVGPWAEAAGNKTQQLEAAMNTMVWRGRRKHRCSVEVEGGAPWDTMITVDDQREPQGEELTRSEGGMPLAWMCKKRGGNPWESAKNLQLKTKKSLLKTPEGYRPQSGLICWGTSDDMFGNYSVSLEQFPDVCWQCICEEQDVLGEQRETFHIQLQQWMHGNDENSDTII